MLPSLSVADVPLTTFTFIYIKYKHHTVVYVAHAVHIRVQRIQMENLEAPSTKGFRNLNNYYI